MTQDAAIRQQALDLNYSFIVQAPAGSGKTELLIQRYLALLSGVKFPEEIIAITFTRKAAGEMRHRVMLALEQAQLFETCSTTTQRLAQKAWKHNLNQGWNLLSNPHRFRIVTIDALTAAFSKQTPLLTGFGANPTIVEEANAYYKQAIRTFLLAQNSETHNESLVRLLLHLDNNIEHLETLLIDLLIHRDQWLPFLMQHREQPQQLKTSLEKALKSVVEKKISAVKGCLQDNFLPTLVPLLQYAKNNLAHTDPSHPLCSHPDWAYLPDISSQFFPAWLGIAKLLLTENQEWRQTVNCRTGFPPAGTFQTAELKKTATTKKKEMLSLLNTLPAYPQLKLALSQLLTCPPAQYTSSQWEIIQALLQVLPVLVAELKIIFSEENIVDFTEMTLGVIRALDEQTSDYALYLDYQIKHLLIDEFQDTSNIQYYLLTLLVRGWQPGDGRTLFLVGDPMQSIYRFRDAEVNLFLQTYQNGLGEVTLKPLVLNSNFRSAPPIVDWVNRVFTKAFQECSSDIPQLTYTPTLPCASITSAITGVMFYPFLAGNSKLEATQILKIIQKIKAVAPTDTIAVLIRSRRQLKNILPLLNSHHIPYQAIDLEPLVARTEIQDLLSLTRALTHLGDTLSWLSILRAPWCGLTLKDLLIITQESQNSTIWNTLTRFHSLDNLSDAAKNHLTRMVPVLTAYFTSPNFPLAPAIKGVWIALGGPATLRNEGELKNVDTFFKLLLNTQTCSMDVLEEHTQRLYATHTGESTNLHIMTIHKAKGLEFDHVILPALADPIVSDKNALLLWFEHPITRQLLLAPLPAIEKNKDFLYLFLKKIELAQTHQELIRLLYVASTRAKKSLHLLLTLSEGEEKTITPPASHSPLAVIWQTEQNTVTASLIKDSQISNSSGNESLTVTRLSNQWTFPINNYHPATASSFAFLPTRLEEYDTEHTVLGRLVHEILEKLSCAPLPKTSDYIQCHQDRWVSRLLELGMPPLSVKESLAIIQNAVKNILEDKIGQWILTNHPEAKSEYQISALLDGKIERVVLDRTFVSDGHQWIIDYKTATPSHNNLNVFLTTQSQKHAEQLHRYAKIMQTISQHPIKLGLYFPLIPAWLAWTFEEISEPSTNSLSRLPI